MNPRPCRAWTLHSAATTMGGTIVRHLSLVCAIAASAGTAVAAEDVVAERAPPGWRVEVAGSVVSAGEFAGWGVGVRVGGSPMPLVQLGVAVDSARLHAEGSFVWQDFDGNSITDHYSQTF